MSLLKDLITPFGLATDLLGGGGSKGSPTGSSPTYSLPAGITADQILKDRPDVAAEYQRVLAAKDPNSTVWNDRKLGNNANDFAAFWYNTAGQNEGYTPSASGTPTPTDPGTTPSTPTTPAGAPTVEDTISQLLGVFTTQAQEQQRVATARQAATDSVNSGLGTGANTIGSDLLGGTVNDLLTKGYGEAQSQLDRGKARGIYNDVGYNAGLASLDQQKAAKASSLSQTANSVLGGYRDKIDAIDSEARNAASAWGGTGTFDLSPYTTRINDIKTQAQSFGSGDLLGAVGTGPLFDVGNIRQDAGTAQGALNLQNLDVLSALAKRKDANSVGRGLGSQGAF